MGGGSSKAKAPPKVEASTAPPDPDGWKKLHSACRWGKLDEFSTLLAKNDIECADTSNGNRSIHIAAQNGHLLIVNHLISKSCEVNAKNQGGQTALHMAMEYDLLSVVLALEAAGADGTIENNAGSKAATGIDGRKMIQLVMLQSGVTTEDFLAAMSSFMGLGEEARKKS
mmetsp:Transcript_7886/g.16188  ORF Transcript_7886/g.16188 Transcript_7886/m.16188 type:complete len:170 (-) Transcript_7886:287-796(-)